MTVDPADPVVHAAWYRLAELVDGYTDLTTAVTQRARRLPPRRSPPMTYGSPRKESTTNSTTPP
ncbi:hypothetical protein [Nocardia xishanensis]